MRTIKRKKVQLGSGFSCQLQELTITCDKCQSATLVGHVKHQLEAVGRQKGWLFSRRPERDLCPGCVEIRAARPGRRVFVQCTLFGE
jgi:hypothetical protein